MTASTDIYSYREKWQSPLAVSAVLHLAFFGGIFGYTIFWHGENWGGDTAGQGVMNATLVSSTVPLPSKPVETQNIVSNDSPGLTKTPPREVPKPDEKAIPIPDKITKPRHDLHTTPQTRPTPVQVAENVVPFGQGGPVNAPLAIVKTAMGNGGVSLPAGGDFGSRYAWYVEAVRRKIQSNWFQYEIDPSIVNAKRVYLTFEIGRGGEPGNVEVSQSSGVPVLDISAKRALQRIDTFGPLPSDYRGSKVLVEFYFDYKH